MKGIRNWAMMIAALSLILSNSAGAQQLANDASSSTKTDAVISDNVNQSPTLSAAAGSAGSPAASVSPGPGQSQPARHASMAKVILGVITGVVVGTPVCAVRRTVDEDKFAVADMTGGNQEKKNVVSAATGWAPFAFMAGVLSSPFWAVNNSLVNYDKPFSREQLSLHQRTGSDKKEGQGEDKNQAPTKSQPSSQDKIQAPSQDK